jgi:hypothetical protein
VYLSITRKGAQKWLIEKCSLNETKILFADNIWKVAYGGNNQIKRIYNLLYDHENLPYHLQRKEDRLHFFLRILDNLFLSLP